MHMFINKHCEFKSQLPLCCGSLCDISQTVYGYYLIIHCMLRYSKKKMKKTVFWCFYLFRLEGKLTVLEEYVIKTKIILNILK